MENLIKYLLTYFLYTLINMTFHLYFRAVFKFDQSNRLGVTATGKEFGDFKTHFEADDRGFGYIRIKVRDILFLNIQLFFSDQNLLSRYSDCFYDQKSSRIPRPSPFANRKGKNYILSANGMECDFFFLIHVRIKQLAVEFYKIG